MGFRESCLDRQEARFERARRSYCKEDYLGNTKGLERLCILLVLVCHVSFINVYFDVKSCVVIRVSAVWTRSSA